MASYTLVDLQHTLRDEIGCYHRLLTLTEQERQALLERDLAALTAVVADKESVAEHLSSVRRRREQMVAQLTNHAPAPANGSLPGLVQVIADAGANDLSELLLEFVGVVEKLLALNHGNKLLLSTQLAQVNAVFELFSRSAQRAQGGYSVRGPLQHGTAAGHVLNREI